MGGGISGERPWRRSRIAVKVAAPAAGADWSAVVPAGHVWNVVTTYAELTTSAAVATRVPNLVITDGPDRLGIFGPSGTQAASLTRRYPFVPSAGGYSAGTTITSSLPDTTLQAGWTIGSLTDAIDVADQWANVVLWIVDTTVVRGSVEFDDLPDLFVSLVDAPAAS